jgi:hypothetical protein
MTLEKMSKDLLGTADLDVENLSVGNWKTYLATAAVPITGNKRARYHAIAVLGRWHAFHSGWAIA